MTDSNSQATQTTNGQRNGRGKGNGNGLPGGISPRTLTNWGPIAGGGALLLYGLSRRSLGGLLLASLGAGLVYRGSRQRSSTIDTGAAVTISQSPEEVYAAWRDLEQLPRYMRNLASIQVLDERRSRWVAHTPSGGTVQWDAEITEDVPNQRIAWRSLEDSEIETSGSVRFEQAPGDRGTEVYLELTYTLPAGVWLAADLALAGYEPSQMARRDLNRFKQYLETGEIPTTDGQPHGPRGRAPAPETVSSALNNVFESVRIVRTGGRPTRSRAGSGV
jgi:uncharacterized membrane protein